jgi:hypothetical protein
MEGCQRQSFADDSKRQAVDLVAPGGRSIGFVAKELVEQRGTRLEPTAATRRPTKARKESQHVRIFAFNSDHAKGLCVILVPPICEQRRWWWKRGLTAAK